MELLLKYVPAMEEWCQKFMHSEPQEGKGNIEFKRSFYYKLCMLAFPCTLMYVSS